MSGTDFESVAIIGVFLLVIGFSGYLIIYNIFQISVVNDISYYGLLKTIGVTGRQLKKIIRIQSLILSAVGIPLGLVLGYFVGRMTSPAIFASTIFAPVANSFSVSPWIFVISCVFALVTVFISCSRPGRIASRISPVEAFRYSEVKTDNKNNKTLAWEYYEKGRAYNNRLVPNQYRLVNTNIEFFAGNQWLHMPETPAMSRLPKPTFNVITRVTSLFVASLTSSATSISYEPLAYYDGNNVADPDSDAASFATSEVQNLLEKFKMDYRIRDAMFDGAQTGDYCAHFYWDPNALPYGGAYGPYRGEIKMELVDGLNVMFGNPNNRNVEEQPYILLIGRDTVENLRAEAKRNQKFRPKDEGDFSDFQIEPDYDTQWQAGIGGRHELIPDDDGNGKALYAYMYFKVTKEEDVIDPKTGMPMTETVTNSNGDPVPATADDGSPIIKSDGTPVYKTKVVRQLVTSVHVTKATKTCTIFEDVDTGLSRYPIAWGNWERQKNQYHGRALVTGIIPNQIFINSMFAMVFRHLQLMGFSPETEPFRSPASRRDRRRNSV